MHFKKIEDDCKFITAKSYQCDCILMWDNEKFNDQINLQGK